MFRWDFAEAILSRWAIKRVCKFLLKKKLGDFILGDIDLDQLEVQLTRGTIQLSDLAVNVDYINQKMAGAAVVLKEGSIASLSIKIPWKLQSCQIELEELELVFVPSMESNIQVPNSSSELSSVDKQQMSLGSDKNEPATCRENNGSVSLDIHKGVETIAKIVKWLLTSFHVKLKNLIVVLDPCLEMNENRLPVNRSLVLRIAETEFGTNLSEDVVRTNIPKSGTAMLTNFVKFEGAVIEILKMTDIEESPFPQDSLESICNECSSSSLSLGCPTAILSGINGGISGRMNISIPWKNGSLDIHKIDAAVCFDPIELRLQPSTIELIITVWESLKNAGTAARNSVRFNSIDSTYSNSRFHSCSSLRNSTILGADITKPSIRKISEEFHSDINGGAFSEDLLRQTHVIQDWFPLSFKEDQAELEQDYEASIDQFFECFDGLQSSLANSGASGLWNWTYSVFSAFNVASNLASGSGQMLTEQHVETCLRATVTRVSLFLYFHDDEENVSDQLPGGGGDANKSCRLDHLSPLTSCTQCFLSNGQSLDSQASCFSSVNADQPTIAEPYMTGLEIHHLEAKCQDVVINFQIGSQKKDCRIAVKHVKIDEYYDHKSHVRMFSVSDSNNLCNQMLINKTLKQKVLDALSPFPVFVQENDLETATGHNIEKISEISYSQEQLIKVGLMETSGDCSFHCVVSLADSDGSSISSTSFSLCFPPCVLWLHFHLVDSLLNFFKTVETFFKSSSNDRDFMFNDLSGDKILVSPHDVKIGDSSIKTVATADNVQGHFVFDHMRIIICFPAQSMEDFGHLYLMDRFIVLEHFPLRTAEEVLQVSPLQFKQFSAPIGSSCTPTFSLHFEVGSFDIYMANSTSKDSTAEQSIPVQLKDVSIAKVLSLTNRTGDKHSGISIVWQKGPVTGPWMAGRAWSMASTHDKSRNEVKGKDGEFSSVKAVENFEKICSDIRQELILSSGFLLCLSFSIVQLNFHSHHYERLNCLLDIVMHCLSNRGSSKFIVSEMEQTLRKHDASQTTIIMDCDNLDLCIVLDEVPDCSHSVQKEMMGSWNCFRLIVEKFEIMSVTNIGDISGANFLRVVHREGKLCGSRLYGNNCTSVATQDVLLISCKNSASRRGGGDGANELSFGSAGTTITYLCDPQSSSSHTSILVHCGTIVAPGGLLDWISHICSFFSLPFEYESPGSDVNQAKRSSNCKTYEASFFLDLVDVALSYEPHIKHPSINGGNAGCDDTFELNQVISEQLVGCLLAASSFSISNYAMPNSAISNYNIQIQDLGLLICQSSGVNKDYGSYDVSYLQKTGYVKVASASLLLAVVKIYGLRWEVECSESHINFDTCHDTTHGLFGLIAQLQQLYAPDMEDALAHLQSRWNSVQQSQSTNESNDTSDSSHSSFSLDAGKILPRSDDNSQSFGLLDGIIENVFHTTEGSEKLSNPYVIDQDNYNDIMNPNSSISLVDAVSSVKMSYNGSACNLGGENGCSESNLGLNNVEILSEKEQFLPHLIESYYFPEAKGSPPVDQRWKYDFAARADVECGKGGWYKDDYPMIVDNHIPNSMLLDSDQHHEKAKFVPVDSDAIAHCSEKGKILLKNIDVRWSMFAGSDWAKQIKNSTGKDRSISLELFLSGLNIQYAIYPEGEVNVSKLSIHAQDFHLYDRSTNAPWKMVIGQYNSKDHPRESYAKAFKLDLETVRPDPITPLEDYRLYVEFLPIRLHLDQSQINFLISFSGNNGSSVEESPSISEGVDMPCIESKAYRSLPVVEEALLPFFQKCDVKPLVVCVDYIPRHMDLASLGSGNYVELLNLVSWKGIDLQLKQVCAVGVYGWGSVCETVFGQWLEDISHNQVHKLLKGLAPVRSLVSVAAGTSKIFTLPVKSYRRDKKLLKGMQRGAIAFFRSISIEAVGLGVHLTSGVHQILLQTELVLRNIPSNAPSPSEKDRIKKLTNTNQPVNAQEGIRQAYESLSDGFSRTASAILGTPIRECQRGAGAGSVVATAVLAAPAAAIAPVTASVEAIRCALLGMRNSLDPEHKKESMNKYLGSSRP